MRLSPLVLCATLCASPALAQTVPHVTFLPALAQDPAPRDVPKPDDRSRLERLVDRIRPLINSAPKADRFRRGFYPKFGGVATGGGWAIGPGYRYEGINDGPVDLDVFARFSWKKYWQVEGRLNMPRLDNGRRLIRLFGRVRDMPQEDFYGFGSDSIEDNRVNYSLREVVAGVLAQQEVGGGLRLHGGAEMVWPDAREGRDERFPSIEELFPTETLAGFGAHSDYFVLRAGGTFDRTDVPGNPRRGPQHLVEASRWTARGGNGSSFTVLHADLRQFIPIATTDRLVALRAAFSETWPASDGEVPLYYQPWIGGGKALRGYTDFRFRDRTALVLQAEYRHRVLSLLNGDILVDGVGFVETGSVGRTLSDLGGFRNDYGIGLRAGSPDGIFFRGEAVFGGTEGTRLFVKFGGPF